MTPRGLALDELEHAAGGTSDTERVIDVAQWAEQCRLGGGLPQVTHVIESSWFFWTAPRTSLECTRPENAPAAPRAVSGIRETGEGSDVTPADRTSSVPDWATD